MWRVRERLQANSIEVLIVSFEPVERVRWHAEGKKHAWPMASDPSRTAYAAYGLSRTSWVRAWLSPRTLTAYARLALRGQFPRRPDADTLQLGGDFLIDPAGIIRFAHRSAEPADRPSIAAVLRVIERS